METPATFKKPQSSFTTPLWSFSRIWWIRSWQKNASSTIIMPIFARLSLITLSCRLMIRIKWRFWTTLSLTWSCLFVWYDFQSFRIVNIFFNYFFLFQCFYQIRALRSLQSKDIIAKELMRRVFSDELCGRLTWKNRKADNRHTFGHLVNLNAVFGGKSSIVLEALWDD